MLKGLSWLSLTRICLLLPVCHLSCVSITLSVSFSSCLLLLIRSSLTRICLLPRLSLKLRVYHSICFLLCLSFTPNLLVSNSYICHTSFPPASVRLLVVCPLLCPFCITSVSCLFVTLCRLSSMSECFLFVHHSSS